MDHISFVDVVSTRRYRGCVTDATTATTLGQELTALGRGAPGPCETFAVHPELFVVTGIMAAGKSTVAQALAMRFTKSVHLRGDIFRRSIVAGREEMSPASSDEAFAQLRLRYRLAANVADEYVRAGFTTVLQDIIIGPMLDEFLAMITTRPFSLVVLSPSVEAVTKREEQRNKTGYTSFTPNDLDDVLRSTTARIGLWIDSSSLTVDETVDMILKRQSEATIPSSSSTR